MRGAMKTRNETEAQLGSRAARAHFCCELSSRGAPQYNFYFSETRGNMDPNFCENSLLHVLLRVQKWTQVLCVVKLHQHPESLVWAVFCECRRGSGAWNRKDEHKKASRAGKFRNLWISFSTVVVTPCTNSKIWCYQGKDTSPTARGKMYEEEDACLQLARESMLVAGIFSPANHEPASWASYFFPLGVGLMFSPIIIPLRVTTVV